MPQDVPANPYAAPVSNTRFRGLSPDTEFIVSGKCVLCEQKIRLPQVCISTGATDDLVQQNAILKWLPHWVVLLRVILTFIGLPYVIGSVMEFFIAGADQATIQVNIVYYAIAVTLAATIVGIWLLAVRKTVRVDAEWYLRNSVAQKLERSNRLRKYVMSGCFTLALLMVFADFIFMNMTLTGVFWLLIVAGVIAFFLRGADSVKPTFLGRYEGLNVLLISEPFVNEVQMMMERRDDSENV